MKKFLAALALFGSLLNPAQAQTGSPKTPTALNTEINTNFPDNTTQLITPAIVRQMLLDGVSSWLNSQGLGGDCTSADNVHIVCTKTNGVAFAPSATTDTTNANNVNSGALNSAQLPTGVDANVLNTQSGPYAVLAGDNGKTIVMTGINQVLTFPTCCTGFAPNFTVNVYNPSTTRGQQIAGLTGLTKLYPGKTVVVKVENGAFVVFKAPGRYVVAFGASINMYFDPANGNDANDCLAASTSACATEAQMAADFLNNIDNTAGGTVALNWPSSATVTNQPLTLKGVNVGNLNLTGSSTVVTCNAPCGSSTNLGLFIFENVIGRVTITGFSIGSTGSGNNGILWQSGDVSIFSGNNTFTAFTGAASQIICQYSGSYDMIANVTVSGSATNHASSTNGCIIHERSNTLTFSGTPAFSGPIWTAHNGGIMGLDAGHITGAATGQSCNSDGNSVLDTGGTFASLPGNSGCGVSGNWGGVVN